VRVPAAGTVSATARSGRGTVAKKTAKLARAGSATLVLTLKARYRRQLHKRHRIPAQVTVRYAPPGSGPGLSAKTKVTFTR